MPLRAPSNFLHYECLFTFASVRIRVLDGPSEFGRCAGGIHICAIEAVQSKEAQQIIVDVRIRLRLRSLAHYCVLQSAWMQFISSIYEYKLISLMRLISVT